MKLWQTKHTKDYELTRGWSRYQNLKYVLLAERCIPGRTMCAFTSSCWAQGRYVMWFFTSQIVSFFVLIQHNKIEGILCRDRTHLACVDASWNVIASVQGLEGCSQLRRLNLSHNKITRISKYSLKCRAKLLSCSSWLISCIPYVFLCQGSIVFTVTQLNWLRNVGMHL